MQAFCFKLAYFLISVVLDHVELVQVEEGRRQLPVDATVRRPQPVQPPQLLRVRRAAGLIDEYMYTRANCQLGFAWFWFRQGMKWLLWQWRTRSMASQVAIARMSAQDTLFRHCGTASRGAVGAGPDAGPGVRDAAAGGVPGEHRPEGRHVHGPRKAGDLLTSVLQEPAGREGPAGLGPGALHRPEVQAHRRRLGPERRYVQSGLRDGHWAGSGSRQGPMGTSVVLN
ncbi:hypothetical protein C2845_PM06G27860 [Panicum miliaceum]|uniref:Secreted protein n=1 Tax=Panicum miliaceum TaxID=4540 RepID=A0A3L6R926_PANMI|nr:hypothetical protein C2845_PM06G27860 [Panicum miliaceum]